MKKEWVAPWIAALESEKYKQVTSKLHDYKGHCCLGVACEVVILQQQDLHFPNAVPWEDHGTGYSLFGSSAVPPKEILTQLGFRAEAGEFEIPAPEVGCMKNTFSLTELNDAGFTFAQIADVVRYFWKEL